VTPGRSALISVSTWIVAPAKTGFGGTPYFVLEALPDRELREIQTRHDRYRLSPRRPRQSGAVVDRASSFRDPIC
jgi:hypothetical protein